MSALVGRRGEEGSCVRAHARRSRDGGESSGTRSTDEDQGGGDGWCSGVDAEDGGAKGGCRRGKGLRKRS